MKRIAPILLLLAACVAWPARAHADGTANADSIYLVGEFVDPVCLFQHGMQGTMQKQCAMVNGRVEQGMYFLDIRQHELYAVIGQNHWQDPRAGFLAALGDTFAVRARVWRTAGARAIAINAMYPWQEQPQVRFALWPWSWHVSVVIGCVVFAALYLLCLTTWRVRLGAPHSGFERGRAALFLSGVLVVLLSLDGPIHDLSDQYFFSTHMVQHLLLAQVFPILFLTGLPPWLRRGLLRPRVVGDTWAILAGVPAGFLLYSVVFSVWHVPLFYNLMMREHSIHIVMHLMVMATATMMWWPIVGGEAVRRPLNHGAQLLYLFLLGVPMMAVAAPIVFAPRPLYDWYAFSPPLWGQSPLEDQRLGALIMWVPGGMFYWGVMSVVYFVWASKENRAPEPFEIPAVPHRS